MVLVLRAVLADVKSIPFRTVMPKVAGVSMAVVIVSFFAEWIMDWNG